MAKAARSLRPGLAAALCLGPLAASAQTPASLRQEIDSFGAALERAVRRVSRPAASVVFSGPAARGYALPGVGVVFVLPPRAVATRRTASAAERETERALARAAASLRASLRRAGSPELRARIERSLEAVRQAQSELGRRARGGRVVVRTPEEELAIALPAPAELAAELQEQLAEQAQTLREVEQAQLQMDREVRRQVEERMRAMHAQAEDFRREAERAREGAERELRRRFGVPPPAPAQAPEAAAAPEAPEAPETPAAPPLPSVPAIPPVALAPPAPAAPSAPVAPPTLPVPPAPPWHSWFDVEERSEGLDAESAVGQVREAVLAVLEAEGARLHRLASQESVVVAVDFVPRLVMAGAPRAQRTLVLRVHKKDIDDRQAGRIGAEEFRRRVEATEY